MSRMIMHPTLFVFSFTFAKRLSSFQANINLILNLSREISGDILA